MFLIAGITMASRRPHKRMKMEGRRILAYCLAVLPHPSPSGFRPRIGVRGMPSIAGMTRWAAGARQSLGFYREYVSRNSSI